MPLLGVNIDHVATVRQARRVDEPDPVWAAVEAELGGADGITFHLREDRRHILDRDARLLKETVGVKLNMEMAVAEDVVRIAEELRPDQCTLVPERREELTTEGGLDVIRHRERVGEVVQRLREAGMIVSAFIEPMEEQVRASAEIGFHAVELWTGRYAHTWRAIAHEASARGMAHAQRDHGRDPAHASVGMAPVGERQAALDELQLAIEVGHSAGLEVHGGHGLTYRNIVPVAAMPGFCEFNIGHSIVSRAVFVGMRQAVKEMQDLIARHARS